MKSLKSILSMVSLEAKSGDELITDITRAEFIANQRPLVEVADDEVALSPADFLWMSLRMGKGKRVRMSMDRKREILRKKWLSEYVSELQKRVKWRKDGVLPRLGDLVVLVDESKKRKDWVLGRIIDTRLSSDKKPRDIQVLTETSKVWRDPRMLVPVERASLEMGECTD